MPLTSTNGSEVTEADGSASRSRAPDDATTRKPPVVRSTSQILSLFARAIEDDGRGDRDDEAGNGASRKRVADGDSVGETEKTVAPGTKM